MRAEYTAAFVRGGTSKALIFHDHDLPPGREARDAIFLRAMGSPDPHGRQLDGMGGGLSSLSKVCVVGPSARPDADVDYAFAQVQIDRAEVDHTGNCGNMSSAIGPFAVDEDLVPAGDGAATVRIHNVNTGKLIHATFQVRDGRAVVEGDYRIQGVAGTGSPVRLDFLDPGGAGTGTLLPGAGPLDELDGVPAALVDAANPVAFLDAAALGLTATEDPSAIDGDPALMARLEELRRGASVRMGLAPDREAAGDRRMTPFVAVVGPPREHRLANGDPLGPDDADLCVRFLSSGQAHRALPLTGALCTAVAARIPGTVVHRHARPGSPVRLASPSGVLEAEARVTDAGGRTHAEHATAFRTTRRLFTGRVSI